MVRQSGYWIIVDEISDRDDEEFRFSRNYFLAKELGGSGKKSTNKRSDIDLVGEQELRAAMVNTEPKHEKEILALMGSYKSLYPQWVLELRCGFALLIYGFGSKKALIEDFCGFMLQIQVVVAMAELLCGQLKSSGKTPSAGLGKVQQPFSSQSMDDLLSFLHGSRQQHENDFDVCLVIHNIDGPGLRDSETQQYLARIAACSHIRIVASVDHVNAPLCLNRPKMVIFSEIHSVVKRFPENLFLLKDYNIS
ncbi:putative plant origin recognition complex subunit [Tripterygium wilfordii]|uniref:Origin recognition complex subunit 2 n=1 Tax=Tripterygium wilfordii TaxID=458696 RepID=A0A7J7CUY8_TRIWF|nr:putative plant origin recognition complex subunit [Tripterygium wilfordii]